MSFPEPFYSGVIRLERASKSKDSLSERKVNELVESFRRKKDDLNYPLLVEVEQGSRLDALMAFKSDLPFQVRILVSC
jgi:hypothetical protein